MINNISSVDEFDKIQNSKKTCVVDFSAVWCGPCRMMEPVLETVSEKYAENFEYYKVDIDMFEELALKYSIMYVPTFIVFKNGKEVRRTTGYNEQEEFENFINAEKAEN